MLTEPMPVEYFVAVAEEASFTRAATRVHVAPPGVSAQVRRLESELGQQLLDRSGRSVRLAWVGAAVRPGCPQRGRERPAGRARTGRAGARAGHGGHGGRMRPAGPGRAAGRLPRRSEERRVGKECRSRWSPDHYKKEKDAPTNQEEALNNDGIKASGSATNTPR